MVFYIRVLNPLREDRYCVLLQDVTYEKSGAGNVGFQRREAFPNSTCFLPSLEDEL